MQMTMAESSKRACRFPGCSRRGLAQFLQTRTLIDDAIGRRIGCDSALKAGVDDTSLTARKEGVPAFRLICDCPSATLRPERSFF